MLGVVLILTCFVYGAHAQEQSLRICTAWKYFNECEQLNRTSQFSCRIGNEVNCLLEVAQKKSDFAVIGSETARIGVNFVENVDVVYQIRSEDYNASEQFRIAVLVKDAGIRSYEDVRGKRLCHPGFGTLVGSRRLPNRFLESLVENLAPDYCQQNRSIDTVQGRFYNALSNILGDSCIEGAWVDDPQINDELKANNTKLCRGCANANCQGKDKTDYEGALQCFIENRGEVVITTDYAINRTNIENKMYLCQGGSVSSEPCYWDAMHWNYIVAHRDVSYEVQKTIFDKFIDRIVALSVSRQVDPTSKLREILFGGVDKAVLVKMLATLPLKEVLEGDDIPSDAMCGKTMKWCTTSPMEMGKCSWFRQAALNQDITPALECVQFESQLECLEAVRKKQADIVAIGTDLGYIARKKSLHAIAFSETVGDGVIKSMIVVKADKNVSGIDDLKGKFGCFSEFGDVAFTSFASLLKDLGHGKKQNYIETMASFIQSSACLPGARDHLRESGDIAEKIKCHCNPTTDKLPSVCNADDTNANYKSQGALKCLDDMGDYAVITNEGIEMTADYNDYRILCKNGTLVDYTGLIVDNNCYLSVTINSEIVIRNDDMDDRNIMLALASFEKIFAENTRRPFDIFGPFNGTKNLLFTDTTPGLTFYDIEDSNVRNYLDIFKNLNNSDKGGAATSIEASLLIVCFTLYLAFNLRNYN